MADREIAELKGRGVVFERYDELPGGTRAAWFKDSEGNVTLNDRTRQTTRCRTPRRLSGE